MIPKIPYTLIATHRAINRMLNINSTRVFQPFCNDNKPKSPNQKQSISKQYKQQQKNTAKKQNKNAASAKTKGYNLEGVDESKLPDHLKKAYQIKKQALNLQVPSQAELQNSIITSQIKRQRQQISQVQTQKPVKFIFQKLLLGLTASNMGITALLCSPLLQNNFYWLGMYSSALLYPSFLTATCMAIGVNLAYLVFRQGLHMHTQISDIKKVDITQAPLSYYLEMGLLNLQFWSLAASVSIPMLFGLPSNYKENTLYFILFCLLAVNGHNTLQQKDFTNPHYRLSVQSVCFVVMFLLSAYVHYRFSVKQIVTDKEAEDCKKFKEGQNRIKSIWKIDRASISQDSKITDIIQKQNNTEQEKQNKYQGKINIS